MQNSVEKIAFTEEELKLLVEIFNNVGGDVIFSGRALIDQMKTKFGDENDGYPNKRKFKIEGLVYFVQE